MIVDLINKAALNSSAEKEGRNGEKRNANERRLTKKARGAKIGGNELRNTVASASASILSLLDLVPSFGEVPRLPDPSALAGENGQRSLNTTRDKLLNEINDRYDPANQENFVKKVLAGDIEAGKEFIENKSMYQKFFKEKTLQKQDLFLCNFSAKPQQKDKTITSPNVVLQYYHFKSVDFKIMPITIGVERVGNMVFPATDPNEVDIEFNVTFEEDAYGTVLNFILQSIGRMVGTGQIMTDTLNHTIGDFYLTTLNDRYTELMDVKFFGVFLVDAGNISFDYSANSTGREYSCLFRARGRTINTMGVKLKTSEGLQNEAGATSAVAVEAAKTTKN